MCVRVSEAEVARLFHQILVRTPVWECVCAGVRSCANRRILLCKEPADTRSPPRNVAGWRSLSVLPKKRTEKLMTQSLPIASDFRLLSSVPKAGSRVRLIKNLGTN